ncbi:MAG: pyruvate kinase [Candidatus Nitrosopolaris sp.]
MDIKQKGRRIEFEILGKRLNEIYVKTIEQTQRAQSKFLFTTNGSENKCSFDNLLCYLALREHDLSDLQLRLDDEGLSSLGVLEGHVLVSIEKVLKHFGISPLNSGSLCKIDSRRAGLLLKKRSNLIFGSQDKGRRTYIMVTLDSSDIYQHELIEQLLENGMDIARINCAHNTDSEWRLIINAIREAEKRLVRREKGPNRKCMILMDLAGPKIRTGPMELKVRPLKISVPKALRGSSVHFLEGFLDTKPSIWRGSATGYLALVPLFVYRHASYSSNGSILLPFLCGVPQRLVLQPLLLRILSGHTCGMENLSLLLYGFSLPFLEEFCT